jgi:hypothetical protein
VAKWITADAAIEQVLLSAGHPQQAGPNGGGCPSRFVEVTGPKTPVPDHVDLGGHHEEL